MADPYSISVTVKAGDDASPIAHGVVIEISPTGAVLGTDRSLPISANLQFRLHYPDIAEEDEIPGRVLSLRTNANDGNHNARTVVRWLSPGEVEGPASREGAKGEAPAQPHELALRP